jgi:hypothetical protein
MKNLLFFAILLLFACKKQTFSPPSVDLKIAGTARNCSDFVVYQYGSLQGDSITFDIRNFAEKLDTAKNQTVTIALQKDQQPAIAITTYKNYVPFSYCPGIIPQGYQPEPNKIWTSESGEMTLLVKSKIPSSPSFPMFKVDFSLKNVVLKNSQGETITIPSHILQDVTVGGPLPG